MDRLQNPQLATRVCHPGMGKTKLNYISVAAVGLALLEQENALSNDKDPRPLAGQKGQELSMRLLLSW